MKTIYIEQLRAHLTFDAHPVAINLVVAPFSAPLDNDLHWYCRCYPVPGHFSLFRLRVFLVNAYMISYFRRLGDNVLLRCLLPCTSHGQNESA